MAKGRTSRSGPSPLAIVRWDERAPATPIASLAELDNLLDSIADRYPADRPVLVEIERRNGDSLTVGLGKSKRKTVLTFVAADKNPPYYSTVGDQRAKGVVVFFYFGHYSEFG